MEVAVQNGTDDRDHQPSSSYGDEGGEQCYTLRELLITPAPKAGSSSEKNAMEATS